MAKPLDELLLDEIAGEGWAIHEEIGDFTYAQRRASLKAAVMAYVDHVRPHPATTQQDITTMGKLEAEAIKRRLGFHRPKRKRSK